ncbi:MAG TPA: hypothetical protein VGL92_08710 [Acidimicrobiia bacterium]|jgi:hypothetical protein
MLGEQLGDDRGQVISTRVLPSEPGQGPRVEVTFETHGTILGIPTKEMGTYWAVVRPNGTLFGEGQGILTSPQGDMASWRGQGVGLLTESGGTQFRGAIYVETASPNWTRLNAVACVYEFSVDDSGKTESKLWEWK